MVIYLILYIDDIVLPTKTVAGQQRLLDAFQEIAEILGITINMSKTEYVVFRR